MHAVHNIVKQCCYLIALMNIVVNQLKQKPHNISQYERGDQVPMDDVSKTSYAPIIKGMSYYQIKVRLGLNNIGLLLYCP